MQARGRGPWGGLAEASQPGAQLRAHWALSSKAVSLARVHAGWAGSARRPAVQAALTTLNPLPPIPPVQAQQLIKLWGLPNTYTLTKRLAESMLLDQHAQGLPVRQPAGGFATAVHARLSAPYGRLPPPPQRALRAKSVRPGGLESARCTPHVPCQLYLGSVRLSSAAPGRRCACCGSA